MQHSGTPRDPADDPIEFVSVGSNAWSSNMSVSSALSSRYVRPPSMRSPRRPPPLAGPPAELSQRPSSSVHSSSAQHRPPMAHPQHQLQHARLNAVDAVDAERPLRPPPPAAAAAPQLSSLHASSLSESCSVLCPDSPPPDVAAASRPAMEAAAHPSPQFWLVDVGDGRRGSASDAARRSPTPGAPPPPSTLPTIGAEAARVASGAPPPRRECPLQLSPWPPASALNTASSLLSQLNSGSNTSGEFHTSSHRQSTVPPPSQHAPLASMLGMGSMSDPERPSSPSPHPKQPRGDGELHGSTSSRGSYSLASSRLRTSNGSGTGAHDARPSPTSRLPEPTSALAAAVIAAATSQSSTLHRLRNSHVVQVPGHTAHPPNAPGAAGVKSSVLTGMPRQMNLLRGLEGVSDVQPHVDKGAGDSDGGLAREEAEAAADAVRTLALSSSDAEDEDGVGAGCRLDAGGCGGLQQHPAASYAGARGARSPVVTAVAPLSAEHHHPHQLTEPRPRAFWRLARSTTRSPVAAPGPVTQNAAPRTEVCVAAGAAAAPTAGRAGENATRPTAMPLPTSPASTRGVGDSAVSPATASPPTQSQPDTPAAAPWWNAHRPPAQLWYAPPTDVLVARGARGMRSTSALSTFVNSETGGGRGAADGLIGDDADDDAPSRGGTAAALPLDERHYHEWLRRQHPHYYSVWKRARRLRIMTTAFHVFFLVISVVGLILLYVLLGNSGDVFLILDVSNRLTKAVRIAHATLWVLHALLLLFMLSFPGMYALRKVWLERRFSAAARLKSRDTLETVPHVVRGMESAAELLAAPVGTATAGAAAPTAPPAADGIGAACAAARAQSTAERSRGEEAERLESTKSWLLLHPSLSGRSRRDDSDVMPPTTTGLSDIGHGGCSSSLSADGGVGGNRVTSPRSTTSRRKGSSGPRGDALNPLAYATLPEQRQLSGVDGSGDRLTLREAPPSAGVTPRVQLSQTRSGHERSGTLRLHREEGEGEEVRQQPHAVEEAPARRDIVIAVPPPEACHAEDEHHTMHSSSHHHHHHYSLVEVVPISPRSPTRMHPRATPDLALRGSHDASGGFHGGALLPQLSAEVLGASRSDGDAGLGGARNGSASCYRACCAMLPSYVVVKFVLRSVHTALVLAVIIASSSLCASGLVTTDIVKAMPEQWGHWLAMSHSGDAGAEVNYPADDGLGSKTDWLTTSQSGGGTVGYSTLTATAAQYRLCVQVQLHGKCSGFTSNCTTLFTNAAEAYSAGCPLCPPEVQEKINAVAGNVTCAARFETVKARYHVVFYVVFIGGAFCSLASLLLVMVSHTHLAWQHLEWNKEFWRR